MKQIFLLLIILILIGGCERTLDSGSVGFDPSDELPIPIALKIYHLADGIELNWQISDTGVVDYYNIYYSDGEENEFILWDSTSLFSKTITTLNTGRVYYFKVAAADTNDVEGTSSIIVSSQIGVTSIVINNNDLYANNTDVSVQFVYPVTPLLVKISEESDLGDAVWQSFRQPVSFELTDGDGVKYLYAMLRFNDGSESSTSVSDSIILDTRAFIDSTYFMANSSVSLAGDTVYFYIDANESGGDAYISFPGLGQLDLYDDGSNGDTMADDGIYSRRYIIPIDLEINDGVVTGRFTDAAGNLADDTPSSDRINIAIPPDPITLQTIAESSSQIRLNWSAVDPGSSSFSSYRIYRETSAGVTESSELIANITSQNTLGYSDENLDDNQLYVYRIYAYSADGLITQSDESSATTMVNTPPTSVTLAVGLEDELTISISWTENGDDDFESYQIYRGSAIDVTDLTGQRLTAINSQTQTSYTDVRFDELDTYYYVIYVYDKQGLKSSKSNVESTP
ncbi:MAG: hypothetical protein GY865_04460 [candidate division Zixibacteria bacterium]|nr:hypothetical protein [candidate division Zixibacteria bacterium]